ncbi:MAG: LemA family protein [Verrucomicrobium sp.]|nr:LemA family protein [Verrucomicrobium sp.]
MNAKSLGLAFLGLLLFLLIAAGGGLVLGYNGLVRKQQAVEAQWAQVENVYQRRADLVPNLVSTVQGAADFEKSTLTAVTDARARVGQVTLPPSGPENQAQIDAFRNAQGRLGATLSRLLVVAERYPELRATDGFRDLQVQLEGTENRIAVERRRFNEAAQAYNTSLRTFPAVLYAGLLGFQQKPYFTAEPGAERPPSVRFNFDGGAHHTTVTGPGSAPR